MTRYAESDGSDRSARTPGVENYPAHAFRLQANSSAAMGSPLYATLLEAAADEIADRGPLHDLVRDWPGDPIADALPLRLMGAVHLLALNGSAPALAEHYPTAGGRPRGTVTAVFLRTIREHAAAIRAGMEHPPQTNEVGRAALLLGGLLTAAATIDLPMRLYEVGASAGLNLQLDRFRYDLGGTQWGDPASPVCVATAWSGAAPPVGLQLSIATRAGCDSHPLDVTDDADMLRLQSYVWPDQLERFDRTRAAIDLARRHPVPIDRSEAVDWLRTKVAPTRGSLAVVSNTIVMQYLEPERRRAFQAAIGDLGRLATAQAPMAWLRFEPGPQAFELRLTMYPTETDVLLAEAQAHGRWVRWLSQ